jgi:hypothetical protein
VAKRAISRRIAELPRRVKVRSEIGQGIKTVAEIKTEARSETGERRRRAKRELQMKNQTQIMIEPL